MTDQRGGYRLLVTGSRDWTDESALRAALDDVLHGLSLDMYDGPVVVVHGDCPTGADAMAGRWGFDHAHEGVEVDVHPADWMAHGKAAGPLRNGHMVSLGADLCLAFPLGVSRGTRDCMNKAEAASIPVQVVASPDPRPTP